MLVSMTSIAGADDFTSDAPALVTQSGSVKVWVVAVPNEVNGDIDSDGCNVGNDQSAPHVVASVTSSDTSVATVSSSTLDFSACGESNSQTITLTLIPDLCLVKTAIITIAESSRGPGESVKGVFNTETINVSVAPSYPSDPSCGGGGGGGGELCAEPAAPAWAAALLKASSLKAKQSKESANYISAVAQHMTNGAVFEDIPKSSQDAYADAVRTWMMGQFPQLTLVSVGDARVIRPGWTCTPIDQIVS
jgi:hypothetical protein